jgi:hypothetical protein
MYLLEKILPLIKVLKGKLSSMVMVVSFSELLCRISNTLGNNSRETSKRKGENEGR